MSLAADALANRLVLYAVAAYFGFKLLEGLWALIDKGRRALSQPAPQPIEGEGHPSPPPADGAEVAAAAPDAPFDPTVQQLIQSIKHKPGPAVILVTVLALSLVTYHLVGMTGAHEDDEDMINSLGAVHTMHVGALAVPYYLRPFFLDTNKQTIPIVDCAYHGLSERVQHAILGDMPAARRALGDGDADAGIAGDLRRAQLALQSQRSDALLRRKKALQRCGLGAAYVHETASAAPSFEAHVTRPPFWDAQRTPLAAASTRVADVIVARNGSRYFSVAAVRQPPGSASYRLMPALVAELDLVLAADRWFTRLTELAGPSESYAPCLCVAHFGIVNSGLHLFYDAAATRWRVRADVEIIFNQSFINAENSLFWRDKPLAFPAVVDSHYGVERLTYSSKVNVRYYDATSFTDDIFARAAREVEGTWVADGVPSVSPFALVVPFRALTPAHRRVEDEGENLCLQHCLAVDRVCAARLG
jgi:hypothetical protein